VQQAIARRAYEWQRAVESGEQKVVGVNVHRADGEQAPEPEAPGPSPEAAERKIRELQALRRARSPHTVRHALDGVSRAAEEGANLMPPIREAVQAYATVGEIAAALRGVFGAYQPPARF